MGAVSGDSNTLSMRCASAADLASRPIAGLKDGDRAYVADRDGTAEGPLFFLNRSSVLVVDGTSVLAAAGGVGRWLAESVYGSSGTTLSVRQAVNPGDPPVPVPGALGAVLTAPAIVAPADGVLDLSAVVQVDGGSAGSSIEGNLWASIDGGANQIVDGTVVGSPELIGTPTGESKSIPFVGQIDVTEGQSVVISVALVDRVLGADSRMQSGSLLARFFRS